jgi:hypothetical protein
MKQAAILKDNLTGWLSRRFGFGGINYNPAWSHINFDPYYLFTHTMKEIYMPSILEHIYEQSPLTRLIEDTKRTNAQS